MKCADDFAKVKRYVIRTEMNGIAIEKLQVIAFGKKNGTFIQLKRGIEGFSNQIQLSLIPCRFPRDVVRKDVIYYLVKKYSKLFKENKAVRLYGDWTLSFLQEKYFNKFNKTKTNSSDIKVNNQIIASEGAMGAIEKNVMDYSNALKQEQAFLQIKEEKTKKDYCKLDIPNGQILSVTFAPYGNFDNTVQGRAKAEKLSVKVDIVSRLGEGCCAENGIKKKHYVIYSESSGWGKTRFADFLVQKCNAQNVSQVNNWCGIRDNVQFLVFDEYDGRFSNEMLRLLTSGNASLFTGNRKSHGKGWVPRPDLQCIFLMNKPLFAYHGVFDKKLQRKVIDKSLWHTFDQRFIHIKLDKNDIHNEDIDVLRYCLPSILNISQKMKLLTYEYYVNCIVPAENRNKDIKICLHDIVETLEIDTLKKTIHIAEKRKDRRKFIKRLQCILDTNNVELLKIYLLYFKKHLKNNFKNTILFTDNDFDCLLHDIEEYFLDEQNNL